MQQLFEPFVKIFSISIVRYFLLAGLPFLIYYIWFAHRVSAAKIQDRSASRRDFRREVWHSMQTTLVFAIIGCLVLNTPVKKYYAGLYRFYSISNLVAAYKCCVKPCYTRHLFLLDAPPASSS
jgi:hypothetical protein